MKRRVEVVSFNEEWYTLYLEEASKVREVFGRHMLNLYHIGSTSVRGLCAKPIIDMLGVVSDIESADAFNNKMEELGYECMGELGFAGRRYYRKRKIEGEEIIDLFHIHLFALDSKDEIERHLAFRDYLREHPAIAECYGALKQRLALEYPFDIDGYCEGKDTFVKNVEKEALKWYQE